MSVWSAVKIGGMAVRDQRNELGIFTNFPAGYVRTDPYMEASTASVT